MSLGCRRHLHPQSPKSSCCPPYNRMQASHHSSALGVPFSIFLSEPMTPMTPTSPAPTEGREGKSKRANPLTDLVETEKAFVEQLTGIIRVRILIRSGHRDAHCFSFQKVAAAWSRSNLPPKELDTMFRSIEGIYKANRGLHAVSCNAHHTCTLTKGNSQKLKDISADPRSAGELGGLLINWVRVDVNFMW